MPLIDPWDGDRGTITSVQCLCGFSAATYTGHYRHVVYDCKLTRCQHCLTVLRDSELTDERFDLPADHRCPRLYRLERGING